MKQISLQPKIKCRSAISATAIGQFLICNLLKKNYFALYLLSVAQNTYSLKVAIDDAENIKRKAFHIEY